MNIYFSFHSLDTYSWIKIHVEKYRIAFNIPAGKKFKDAIIKEFAGKKYYSTLYYYHYTMFAVT